MIQALHARVPNPKVVERNPKPAITQECDGTPGRAVASERLIFGDFEFDLTRGHPAFFDGLYKSLNQSQMGDEQRRQIDRDRQVRLTPCNAAGLTEDEFRDL